MIKTAIITRPAIILGVLLAGYSVGPLAGQAADGVIELNAGSMDGVTAAGSSLLNPASAALQALADAQGDLTLTGTSANTYIQDASTRQQFGSAAGYILAQLGTASATSTGAGANQSTQIATTPDANAPNPYGGTIDYTRSVLGTEISVFSQVRPGGYGLDFFHHKINNLR